MRGGNRAIVAAFAAVLAAAACARPTGPVAPGDVKSVVAALSSSSDARRAAAEKRLSVSDPKRTWSALTALFRQPTVAPAAARTAAIRIFVRTATIDLPDVVPDAAVDPDADVRHEALGALLAWGDPRKAMLLDRELATVTDPAIRADVTDARAKLLRDRHLFDLRRLGASADRSDRLDAARALADFGRPSDVLPMEQDFMREQDVGIRQTIVMSIAKIGSADAVNFVRSAIAGGDPYVRAGAAIGEQTLKDPLAVPPLGAMLEQDPIGDNRINAANALAAIGTPEARAALEKGCRTPITPMVQSACDQLTKAGARRPRGSD